MSLDCSPNVQVSPLVLPLDSPENTLATAGGKGANLGVLLRAGLPVPPGFCLTTAAYAYVCGSEEQSATLEELAAIDADDPAVTGLAERMQLGLREGAIPADLERAIVEAYERMGTEVQVAVRSSATAEDLPTASFAGQQDSYLGIVGREALLTAIRNCWASLWNERAVRYRAANGIDPRGVHLAVVVQRMVDAQVAGVLFTANPLTGSRRQAVIDASFGLGEAVVSGAVNPDHFTVDRLTGAILERRLGDKQIVIRQVPGGGTVHEDHPRGTASACVTDEQIRQLVELGESAEKVFGVPQDIEFAFDQDGRLWQTQARPITTLYPLPSGASSTDLRVYFSMNVFQGMFQPFTPMGLQAFRLILAGFLGRVGFPVADPTQGPPFIKVAGQRIFVDLTGALRNRFGGSLLRRVMPHMEARSAVILERLTAERPELQLSRSGAWPVAMGMRRVMARTRFPVRVIRAFLHPEPAIERAVACVHGSWNDDAPDPLVRVERMLTTLADRFLVVVPVAVAGVISGAIARALLKGIADVHEFDAVRRALPHNPTTEMDLALWDLSQRLRQDPEGAGALRSLTDTELSARYAAGQLPSSVQTGMADFLRVYGQRGLSEIDMGTARWSEDPAYLFGVLQSYLGVDDPALAPDRLFKQGQEEAERMVEELARRAARRNPLRGKLVRLLLGRMRAMLGLREGHKFILVSAFAGARRLLWEVGEQLATKGAIAESGDIFFMSLAEVRRAREGEDFRSVVQERRQAYQLELRRRQVPRVMLSDGTVPTSDQAMGPVEDGSLVGTPASAGTVTGRARVVLSPHNAKLQKGDILVAPSTDPGWTPLFLTAAGLVMEMGGPMSHGAVVAREYGIPAVVGVAHATRHIPDGALIEVDGTSGVVRRLDERTATP